MESSYLTIDKLMEMEELINGAETVDITGYGEIIMHPQFKELSNLLTRKNKMFSFSTNGSLLNQAMVDYLDFTSLYLINISVNSLNPVAYKKLTGNGELDRLLANLNYLFSRPHRFLITLSMVVNNYSIRELPQFVETAIQWHAHQVRFLPLTDSITNYPADIILQDTATNRRYLADAERLANHRIRLQTFSFDPATAPNVVEAKRHCKAPFTQMCIGADGNVAPCCWLGHISMGNLKETSWQEIWNSDKYADLRQSVVSGNMKYCANCREFG
jgi:MoaA/NifB/PqqE/SkfB family radical SAM enzyme